MEPYLRDIWDPTDQGGSARSDWAWEAISSGFLQGVTVDEIVRYRWDELPRNIRNGLARFAMEHFDLDAVMDPDVADAKMKKWLDGLVRRIRDPRPFSLPTLL